MSSPYPQPGGPTPQPIYYAAPQRFEPLERRAKRASFWAGAVGLNFMSAGASVLVATVLVGAALALFAGVSSSASENSGLQGFDEFLGQAGAPFLFLVAVLVGAVIFAIGMFASVGILKAGRVRRPWAVTWSAFAISLPVLWVVNGLAWIVGQFVATAGMFATFGSSFDGTTDSAPLGDASAVDSAVITGIVIAVVGFLLTIAVVGLIGWLAWWWMAHVFRLRVAMTDASGAASPAARPNARRDDGGGGYYAGGYSDGGGNYTGRDNDGGSGWGSGDSGSGGGDGGGGGGGGD